MSRKKTLLFYIAGTVIMIILGGSTYFLLQKYISFRVSYELKRNNEANTVNTQEVVQPKKEIKKSKNKQTQTLTQKSYSTPETQSQNKSENCNDISLDKFAPGYTTEDLQRFLGNAKDVIKNSSMSDAKYIMDGYFGAQWETVMPGCKAYINNLVESRRTANKQEEEIKRISVQQQKLIDYNQCLLASDRSTCESLLY